jgi:hypothetical protein
LDCMDKFKPYTLCTLELDQHTVSSKRGSVRRPQSQERRWNGPEISEDKMQESAPTV